MRGIAIALSILMLGTGVMSFASAPPATIQGYSAVSMPIPEIPSGTIQLAQQMIAEQARLKSHESVGPVLP